MKCFLEDQDSKEHFEIPFGTVILGRDPKCNIALDSQGISRRHLRFVMTPTELNIQDLGSSNGTFVNGKRVAVSRLVEGDVLKIGKKRFILRVERGAEAFPEALEATMAAPAIQVPEPDVDFTPDPGARVGEDTPVDSQFVQPEIQEPQQGGMDLVRYEPGSGTAQMPVARHMPQPYGQMPPYPQHMEPLKSADVEKPKFRLTKRIKIIGAALLAIILITLIASLLMPRETIKDKLAKEFPDVRPSVLAELADEISKKLTVENGNYSALNSEQISSLSDKIKARKKRIDEFMLACEQIYAENRSNKDVQRFIDGLRTKADNFGQAYEIYSTMLDEWVKNRSNGWENFQWDRISKKVTALRSTEIIKNSDGSIEKFLNGLWSWVDRENRGQKDIIAPMRGLIEKNDRASLEEVIRKYGEKEVVNKIPANSVYRKVYLSMIREASDKLLAIDDKAVKRKIDELSDDKNPDSETLDFLNSLTKSLRKAIEANNNNATKFHKEIVNNIQSYYLRINDIYQGEKLRSWSDAETNLNNIEKILQALNMYAQDRKEKIEAERQKLVYNKEGEQKLDEARSLSAKEDFSGAESACNWVEKFAPAYREDARALRKEIREIQSKTSVSRAISKLRSSFLAGEWEKIEKADESISAAEKNVPQLRNTEEWTVIVSAIRDTIRAYNSMLAEKNKDDDEKNYEELLRLAKRVSEASKDFDTRYKIDADNLVAGFDDEFFADWYLKRGRAFENKNKMDEARTYYDKANEKSAGKASTEIGKIRAKAKELYTNALGRNLDSPENQELKEELNKIFDGLRDVDNEDRKIYDKVKKLIGR